MPEIEQVKLSEFFRSVKKPRYVLGTTYTLSLAFFESIVYSCIERRELKYCLIISDAHGYHRSLEEGTALQSAAQGYMVVPAPVPGCFHPKVWLLIGEDEAALLVGSGNLTQSGFMTNAELFDSLVFSKETPPTRDQLTAIVSFLAGLAAMWPAEDRPRLLCVDMLAEMRREIGTLAHANRPSDPEEPRFIHAFAGPMLSQLPEPQTPPKLYVAAPYFGNSLKGLDLLQARFSPSATRVYPAVHEEATDFPVRAAKALKKTHVARLHIAGKKTFTHLKLYGAIQSQGRAWLCCTSANCTDAAWQGPNIEAGLVRTVTPAVVASYFRADKEPLPEGTLVQTPEGDYANRLHLWATESGMGVDISVSVTSTNRLPLKSVIVTLRVGSNTSVAKRDSMFVSGRSEHLLWSAFDDQRRTRNMAICLEIHGQDAAGKEVTGACFVENRMLLTADPLHRSAWRGALALLDTEVMPDLSDIAAIFTLVSNIFDGRLISRTPAASDAPAGPEVKKEDAVIHVPIWPPQPDPQSLHRRIGTTGLGQLALCQKILATLLRPQPPQVSGAGERPMDESEGDSEGEGVDSDNAQRVREEAESRTKSVAKRLWERAEQDYDRLRSRLQQLVPTEDVAPNIWPASVFVFLATAAIHRATSRVSPQLEGRMPLQDLVEEFLYLMLDERKQDPDFCCPQGFRYHTETFPALADDLKTTFKVLPDPDIATVMVAMLTTRMARMAPNNEYPVMWRWHLTKIVGTGFRPTEQFGDACRRIWSVYLHDENGPIRDGDFTTAYAGLWRAYEGSQP